MYFEKKQGNEKALLWFAVWMEAVSSTSFHFNALGDASGAGYPLHVLV